MKKKIGLCLSALVLLSLPWQGLPGYSLLFAFVPLFLLQEKGGRIWPWILGTFALWSTASVWWVSNSILLSGGGAVMAVFVAVACVAVTTFVVFLPFMAYHYVWKRARRALAYTVLVSAWVGYEFVFLHGQITFPWLILGNGFANSVEAVQWYEYTGALGGSVWVWVCNIAICEAIRARRGWLRPAAWAGIPMALSLILFFGYKEKERPVAVQIIQPDFDPYEKFEALSFARQTEIMLQLALRAPANTEWFVAPETAIDERIPEPGIGQNQYVELMRRMLRSGYPGADFVIGATTLRYYRTETEASHTARPYLQEGEAAFWYDLYNTALRIDTTQRVGISHKSKLVAGAEMIPYSRRFPFLKRLSMDLGGTSGGFGTDPERSVFTSASGVSVGTPICWEAVFGEYTTGFVKQGAQALFIISNDSWWGDTAGYRQLFAFSRLRAVETRRSIARSANTGLSGFIDQRGRVTGRTRWDERTALSGRIGLNDKMTFYVRFGDMTGRIAVFVFLLCLLCYIASRRKKRDGPANFRESLKTRP